MTEFLLRVQTDLHAPDYQPGDAVNVREQDHAEPGQLCVVNIDQDAVLRRYKPGMAVLGVVTDMYRRVAGNG